MTHIPGNTDGPAVLAVGWVLLSGSFITIALRLYHKIFVARKIGTEDWLILVALAFATLHTSLITEAIHNGLGHNYPDLTAEQAEDSLKYGFLSQPWTIMASLMARLSFCFLLLSIVGHVGTKRRASLWLIIAIQILTNVPTAIQVYAQCGTHFSANWGAQEYAHCNSPKVQVYLGYSHAAVNVVCDLALAILPAMILWDLNMKSSLKFGLLSILCLSVFGAGASAAKGVEIKNLSNNVDGTRKLTFLFFCAFVEENVVMMAASIATLRPLIANRNKGSGKSSNDRHSKYGKSAGDKSRGGTIKAETEVNIESVAADPESLSKKSSDDIF